MAWTCLFIAGLLEIAWAIGLKYTDGFSRLWPSVATIALMVASFALLSFSLKTIPVGTGYAVWTGIGAAGTALIGIFFLGEPRDTLRLLCILLIITGVIGLRVAATPSNPSLSPPQPSRSSPDQAYPTHPTDRPSQL